MMGPSRMSGQTVNDEVPRYRSLSGSRNSSGRQRWFEPQAHSCTGSRIGKQRL